MSDFWKRLTGRLFARPARPNIPPPPPVPQEWYPTTYTAAAVPGVQPVTVIAIVAGATLGARAGFATGALAAFVSNLFLGQGIWTPQQMLGWGLCGAAGALLAPVVRTRIGLAVVGAVLGFAFSVSMDLWLWWGFAPHTLPSLIAVVARGQSFVLRALVLQLEQLEVNAPRREERLVAPLLADSALVQDENLVHVLDGGEPMRDGDGGAAVHERSERLPDEHFSFGVDARGRLVEH